MEDEALIYLLPVVVGVIFLALMLSRTTLADAKAAMGTGTSRVYEHPFEVVWDATVESVTISGLDLLSADKSNGMILAQRGMSGFSYGENVAVRVTESEAKTSTRVEVVSKRRFALNFTAVNSARRILDCLDKELGPGKQAQP